MKYIASNACAAVALAALAGAAAPAAAQVYKWVDANGKVQYSDRKPEEQPAGSRPTAKSASQEVRLHVAPAPPPPTAEDLAARREKEELRKFMAPAPAPKASAPAGPPMIPGTQIPASGSAECDNARKILSWIKDGTARHSRGNVKTDDHDREMYEREVATHCKR